MDDYSIYVGLDVHKESIVPGIAERAGGEPEVRVGIPNTELAMTKFVRRLAKNGDRVAFCYEAGPCGYGLYRLIRSLGHDCIVVAPSLIPRKPGDRIKTDRRDAGSLARAFRSGDLTPVWVPDDEHESMRDLTRAREDMKSVEQRLRQRLSALLLRHGKKYPGRTTWGRAYLRWLETLKFETQTQQIVFQEYVDAVKQAEGRVASLDGEMSKAVQAWSLEPVVMALTALRGINLLSALSLVAELGDLTRFDSPSQLMGYVGLVSSEHSSGPKQRRGAITKAGNGHARRILVEASWAYRFPARKTAHLQRRAEKAPERVQAIAWKAQKRLCRRYRYLTTNAKKLPVVAVVAIARELAGFIWAIAREVTPPQVCPEDTKSRRRR
jgi:transposase